MAKRFRYAWPADAAVDCGPYLRRQEFRVNRFDFIESLERRTYFSPLVFSSPASFPTGAHPSDVVTEKLTTNGLLDVVTTNFASASVSVLMGNGNGTFQSPVYYQVGNSPESLAVADFNGDGIPDLVTANEADNTVSVLIGNGDGTFQPQVTYPVGLRPESVAAGDLTGTGANDIVVADDGSADVDVLKNNGDGSFQPAESYSAGTDPDGIAVGDFNGDNRPDIVVINPLSSYIHVLMNKGDGTFAAPVTYTAGQTPRAVVVADINSDGRPDIITTSLHNTTVDVLLSNGNGTFRSTQSYATGYFPFSLAVGDMNGDGRADVVTANELGNTVGVLLHTGTGTFLKSAGYHGGQAPVGVAVGDFNGDGKPDIVAADFNTNSISILTNETLFPDLVPTTLTLTPNQNPVEVGNRLVLSAQVAPSATAGRAPIGVVQFLEGDAVLGVAKISKSGVATLSISKLALGSNTIIAHYAGDGLYEASDSTPLVEQVVTADQTTPLVSPTITAIQLAKQYVPGDRGVAKISITDIGDGLANGVVGLQLFASNSTTFDSTAFAITINSKSTVAIKLKGGYSQNVSVTFTMPTTISPENYTIFAALTPVSGLTAGQVSTTVATGLNTAVPILEFGRVPTHGNYKLTRELTNGAVITLAMTGPGTGTFTQNADGGISVILTGTGGPSSFTISGAAVTLDSLTDNNPIGKVNAPTAALDGPLSLNGSTTALTIAGATNSTIFVGGGAKAGTYSLGAMSSTSLYVAGAIKSLAVTSWTNTPADTITTAVIGAITSAGDFGTSLTVNGGTGRQDLGIASATIGGMLTASTWSIQKSVGTIKIAGIAAGWSGSIHGTIYTLTDTGDFLGNLAAYSIGTVQISGSLTSADILAGADFGATAMLSVTGDNFGRGTLTSLVINGNVTNSVVAAGISPLGGQLLGAGTTLLSGSAIKSISVSGAVDTASKFVAVLLPATASIDGIQITTATDPNFQLG